MSLSFMVYATSKPRVGLSRLFMRALVIYSMSGAVRAFTIRSGSTRDNAIDAYSWHFLLAITILLR